MQDKDIYLFLQCRCGFSNNIRSDNEEILNYENVATDCGVSANTVKAYYKIPCDTLLGFEVPAYRKVIKRKLTKASRFYFFDVGIANYLTGRHHLAPKTPEYGHAP